jgi:hypothetical protein
VAFVVWARSVREPLVDLGLFRHRTYSAVNAATLTFGIAFAMMFFAFFFFMGSVWHYSQARAGVAIAPGPLTVIPVAVLTGRLAARSGTAVPHRRGLALCRGSALVPARPGRRALRICCTGCPGLLLSGASVGLVMPSLSAAAVEQIAGRALRRGQRRQPGDAPDRFRDRCRHHRPAARPRHRAAQATSMRSMRCTSSWRC